MRTLLQSKVAAFLDAWETTPSSADQSRVEVAVEELRQALADHREFGRSRQAAHRKRARIDAAVPAKGG